MSENTKKNPVTTVVNFVKRNERRILITTSVASTAAAVAMGAGLKQHNEFLKENGLFDKFYNLNNPEA